ncbi:MAG: hypothetical protein VYE73_11525 [Acidobacteriota bacterium]|nr:hypothetical protein [Acidobacteriota bacterium]
MSKTLVLTVAVLVSSALSVVSADDIPRTPSGQPDFSGTYDISVLTPYERDPKYGDTLYMDGREAREIEQADAAAAARANEASDPNRSAPAARGDEEFGGVGAYNRFWLDRGTTTFAIDGKYRTSILTDPPNGRLPTLTEAGEKRRADLPAFGYENTGTAWWLENGDDPYDGPESLTPLNRCVFHQSATIPIGPRAYNNVKTITQTETHVVLLVEWMHWARVIRLDSEHAHAGARSMAGDSIGWFEGDTLVVDTTHFMTSWHESREGLHVVERFTHLDEDNLLYEFTVNDPEHTAPYSGSLPWPRTDKRLYEFACHEGNYSVGNSLRGARFLEQEWRQQQGR